MGIGMGMEYNGYVAYRVKTNGKELSTYSDGTSGIIGEAIPDLRSEECPLRGRSGLDKAAPK